MDVNLTKKTVDAAAAPESGAKFYWDEKLAGFGIRVTASGVKAFICQYRAKDSGKTRRTTIGRHGKITCDQARAHAQKLITSTALGGDPVAETKAAKAAAAVKELTVNDLLDRYLTEHVARNNKASTQHEIRRTLDTVVRPKIGSMPLSAISRGDVKRWHAAISQSAPVSANRALAYLRRAFRVGIEHELLADNPCRDLTRNKEIERDRYFSDDELRRIGTALRDLTAAERLLPSLADGIRLLALTGLRLSEMRNLAWAHLDRTAEVLRLADGKTGARAVPLCREALQLLDGMERIGPFIVAGFDPTKPVPERSFATAIARVLSAAGVEDGSAHVFRHTIATHMAQAGADVWQIMAMGGWKSIAMPQRYVSRSAIGERHPLPAGERIAIALAGDNIVPLKRPA